VLLESFFYFVFVRLKLFMLVILATVEEDAKGLAESLDMNRIFRCNFKDHQVFQMELLVKAFPASTGQYLITLL
jgi:hypothetical protein